MNIEKEIDVKVVNQTTTVKAAPSAPAPKKARTSAKTPPIAYGQNAPTATKGVATLEAPPSTQETGIATEEAEEVLINKLTAYGGDGGTKFEYKFFDDVTNRYHRIKKLEVCIEKYVAMRGIRVTFDNDTIYTAGVMDTYTSIFGNAEIHALELKVDQKEAITHTTIYTCPLINVLSLSTPMVNGIEIKTTGPQTFDHSAGYRPVINVQLEVTPNPYEARGVLIGIYGRAGANIDKLGLILEVPKDAEYIIDDVQFQLNDYTLGNQQLVTVQDQECSNESDGTVTLEMEIGYELTNTESWTDIAELKVGAKTTVLAGIPMVAGGEVEVSAEVTRSSQWGTSTSTTLKYIWKVAVSTPPHARAVATATIKKANISIPFKAKLFKAKSDNSRVFVDEVAGTYQGVTVSDIKVKAKTLTD